MKRKVFPLSITIYIYLLFFSSILISNYSFCQNWENTPDGPFGGDISAISAVDSFVIIGTDGGLYISTDAGANWKVSNNGLTNLRIECINIINDTIYVGTGWAGDIFYSTDQGVSWNPLVNGLATYEVNGIVELGDYLFAGTSSGVFMSMDGGLTWIEKNNGFPTSSKWVKALAGNSSSLYVVTDGIYVSRDTGNTWTLADAASNDLYYTSLTVNDSIIFAGTSSTATGSYFSTDDGVTWSYVSNWPGWGYINAMTFLNDNIYIATWFGEIYGSSDNGNNWFDGNSGLTGISIESMYGENDLLYAGSEGGGIYVSKDFGVSWQQSNKSMNATEIRSLVSDGENIYATTFGNGVWSSSDKGDNWNSFNTGLSHYNITSIAIQDTLLWLGAYEYLASKSGGCYLYDLILGQWKSSFGSINILDITTTDSMIFISSTSQIIRSEDFGLYWQSAGNGLPSSYISEMLITDTNMFVVISYYPAYGGGIFRSENYGDSWYAVNNGLPQYTSLTSVISVDSMLISSSNDSGVYISYDLGSNWSLLSDDLYGIDIDLITRHDTMLYAGTQTGVFVSEDYGINWARFDSSLNVSVTSFLVDSPYLFAGTPDNGLWRKLIYDTTNFCISTATESQTICSNDSIFLGGSYQNTSGVYYDTLSSGNECDSAIATTLTVNTAPSAPTISENNGILTSSASSGNQWYMNSNIIPLASSQSYTPTENGAYTVTVSDSNNCSSKSDSFIVAFVGIAENATIAGLSIYPNPNSGKFEIKSNGQSTQHFKITIYNVMGEFIYTTEADNNLIVDLSNNPSGIYIIKIQTRDSIITKNILLSR